MAEFTDYRTIMAMDNVERRGAALTLALAHGHDNRLLAYYLVVLGLAEHRSDGSFVSTSNRDGDSWHSGGDDRAQAPFLLPVGQLDDCR